jgi:AcrR family transcriptional regulator
MNTDILSKIEELFFAQAFSDLSMEDIAKGLNMKKASLYYHFASKDEMFARVLEYSFNRYFADIGKILD